jgi:hypothetical protein
MLCWRSGRLDTVAQAAIACGFHDFGRFAEKYSQLFGELPSRTLRTRPGPSPVQTDGDAQKVAKAHQEGT